MEKKNLVLFLLCYLFVFDDQFVGYCFFLSQRRKKKTSENKINSKTQKYISHCAQMQLSIED